MTTKPIDKGTIVSSLSLLMAFGSTILVFVTTEALIQGTLMMYLTIVLCINFFRSIIEAFRNAKGGINLLAAWPFSELTFLEKIASVTLPFAVCISLFNYSLLFLYADYFNGMPKFTPYFVMTLSVVCFIGLLLECCRKWQLAIHEGVAYISWGSVKTRGQIPTDKNVIYFRSGNYCFPGERYDSRSDTWYPSSVSIRASGWIKVDPPA